MQNCKLKTTESLQSIIINSQHSPSYIIFAKINARSSVYACLRETCLNIRNNIVES